MALSRQEKKVPDLPGRFIVIALGPSNGGVFESHMEYVLSRNDKNPAIIPVAFFGGQAMGVRPYKNFKDSPGAIVCVMIHDHWCESAQLWVREAKDYQDENAGCQNGHYPRRHILQQRFSPKPSC